MSTKELNAKIVLLGEATVGKTCTAVKYVKDTYIECPPTVVASYSSKKIHIGDRSLRLSIWDTAGQERYRSLTSIYYRGASGALIFYDITRRSTFDEKIEEWVNEVRSSASQGISIVVVGNKVDNEANRQVSTREGMACAEMLGVPFFEISAKTGTCVAEAFTKLAELIMEDQNLSDGSDGESDNDNVEITDISVDNQENEGNCAC